MVSRQDLSNISARVFVQLLIVAKYYDCDIDGAENGKLMRLLEKSSFPLEKRPAAAQVSSYAKMEV